MRSIACMVCAEKYDSPQLGHDHMGIASMTSKAAPFPKLRVTCFNCADALPQQAHWFSTEVGSDDDEPAGEADFDDCFRGRTVERGACDDALDFARLSVALPLGDLPREDDIFEIVACAMMPVYGTWRPRASRWRR